MPTFQMISVAKLVDPLNPQRQETLYERIDELRASIQANGLQQPIGVRDLTNGEYRIIYGHRRSIAVTQLGWSHVPSLVFGPDEGDEDVLMGAENYHRTQTNDAEEARYYQRILPKYPEGTIGMAKGLNVPQARIERLLLCLQGDPKVFELMGLGKLSLAQAFEINKFQSPGYRLQAIERCLNEGIGADILRRWRSDLQRQGIDQAAVQPQATWTDKQPVTPDVPTDMCNIGNHMVPLQFRKVYAICNEHYNVFLEGLEALGKIRVIEEAGLLPQFMRLLHTAEEMTNTSSEAT